MSTASFLTEQELDAAAFALLSSSTGQRYWQQTENVCRTYDLFARAARAPEEVARRAKALWSEVERTELRDLAELELALLLVAGLGNRNPQVQTLAQTISSSLRGNASWLAGLAQRLLRLQRSPRRGLVDVALSPGYRGPHRYLEEAPSCI